MQRILLSFLMLCFFALPFQVQAQENTTDFESRLELARQMQSLRPAREQVNNAIEQYVKTLPEKSRGPYRAALHRILNYRALEKISTDAYAEIFTQEELQAMVDYYSKPEARSASDKLDGYGAIVYPEVIRMLDRAVMQIKTGGAPP